jgi:hypothetical protein
VGTRGNRGCKRDRTSGNIDIFIDLPLLLLPSLRSYPELGRLECLKPITAHISQRMESHLCEPITDLSISVGGGWEFCVNILNTAHFYGAVCWNVFQLIGKNGFLFDVGKQLSTFTSEVTFPWYICI